MMTPPPTPEMIVESAAKTKMMKRSWIQKCCEKLVLLNAELKGMGHTEQAFHKVVKFLNPQSDLCLVNIKAFHLTFEHTHKLVTRALPMLPSLSEEDKVSIYELTMCKLSQDILDRMYPIWIHVLFKAATPFSHSAWNELTPVHHCNKKGKFLSILLPVPTYMGGQDAALFRDLENLYEANLPPGITFVRESTRGV